MSASVMLKFGPMLVVGIKVKCNGAEEGRSELEAGMKDEDVHKNVR